MLFFNTTLLLLVSFLYLIKKKQSIYTQWLSVFVILWLILINISMNNPFNLDDVKYSTYIILYLFIFSYSLGFLVPKKAILKKSSEIYPSLVSQYIKLDESKLLTFIL